MFRSVRIQNFRQFKDLELKNLGRINLITGQNNTGKTSLLEALNMLAAPNDPSIVATHARLRGVARLAVSGSQAWGFIFHDGQTSHPIVLTGTHDDGRIGVLRVQPAQTTLKSILDGGELNGSTGPLTLPTSLSSVSGLEYEYASEPPVPPEPYISRIVRDDRKLMLEQAEVSGLKPWYFLAQRPAYVGQSADGNRPSDAEVEAQRFSQLALSRRKHEVIEAVRVVEPRLTDLEVLDLPPPMLAADIGLPSLVPVAYLGLGFEQMLKVVQAILSTAGGVVLIDELENGLHYSVLPAVWKAIIAAAHKHDVQIFATTHSLECVKAAADVAKRVDDGLVLHRLSRRDGQIRTTLVEDEGIRAAVGFGFELR